MLEKILRTIEKFIPKKVYRFFQPYYHFTLALLGAILYRFPSKQLITIGVTGTKGKSTTAEMMYRILTEAGHKTALINTIEFRIGNESMRNMFKMTTPGRFILQGFLRDAINKNCTHAVVEVSSEAVLQFRHRFLYLDALIVTNLSPEHIERHGSYENYREAKMDIARRVLHSGKKRKILILNDDCAELKPFETLNIPETIKFSKKDSEPYLLNKNGTLFSWKNRPVNAKFVGEFNLENTLGALTLSEALNLPREKAVSAIEKFEGSRGRVQKVDAGQNFTAVVDYAHTPDSMQKLYEAFKTERKICVFGATGGGRDKWKRSEMGKVASQYCDQIILTNDDPYDEDPQSIIEDIKKGITNQKTESIIDRREAIRKALHYANQDSVVLISGKGTDPYLMEANNKKTPWSDYDVTLEELRKLHH